MRMCVRLRTMQSTVLRRAKEPTNSEEDEGQEVTMRYKRKQEKIENFRFVLDVTTRSKNRGFNWFCQQGNKVFKCVPTFGPELYQCMLNIARCQKSVAVRNSRD